jgi:hypothetical protein
MDKIVRGYILPKPGGVYIEEIRNDEGTEMLEKYREVLENIIIDFMKGRSIDKIREKQQLYDLLNEIVTTIRWTLYLDPIPEIIPSPAFLITYLIRIGEKIVKDREKTKHYIRDLIIGMHEPSVMEHTLKKSAEYRKFRDYILDILRYPADTRYGANTSSLIIHMITSSAIASCLLLSRAKHSKDIQDMLLLVRLVSLFHDVGKFNMKMWHKHEETSIKFIDELFNKYVDGEAKELIDEVRNVIKEGKSKYGEIIINVFREADGIASNIDRLAKYSLNVLSENVRLELLEYARKYGKTLEDAYKDWRFWDFIGYEMVKKLSEDFCRNASKISSENPLLRIDKVRAEEAINDVLMTRIDIRNIQGYIRVNDLRSICGASRIIDILCLVLIPYFVISRIGIPAECVLYFGGGNVTVLIPADHVDKLNELRSIIKQELDLDITYGSSPLHPLFPVMNYNIDCELMRRKMFEAEKLEVNPNISYICDFCGSRIVEEMEDGGERIMDNLVCHACRIKYDVGDQLHLDRRINKVKSMANLNIDLSKLKKYVMEYIAGVDYDSISREEIEQYPNMALIRFDANLASLMMMSCISISDAIERSIRIDFSIKKAIQEFIEYVKGKYVDDYFRLVLGIMYVGGDDGFLLTPSYIAIPLAIHLAKEFHIQMGGKATLSIGIAVAKPKHPILELYRSAGYLLDSYAKERARRDSVKIASEGLNQEFYGSIAFYVADVGTMTEYSLDYVIDIIGSRKLSLIRRDKDKVSSFTISRVEREDSIFRLLNVIFEGVDVDTFNYRSILDVIVDTVNKARNHVKSSLYEKLVNLRNDVLDVMKAALPTDDGIKVKLIYAKRQRERLGEKHYYGDLVKNLFNVKEMTFALHDMFQIIKMINGGFEVK